MSTPNDNGAGRPPPSTLNYDTVKRTLKELKYPNKLETKKLQSEYKNLLHYVNLMKEKLSNEDTTKKDESKIKKLLSKVEKVKELTEKELVIQLSPFGRELTSESIALLLSDHPEDSPAIPNRTEPSTQTEPQPTPEINNKPTQVQDHVIAQVSAAFNEGSQNNKTEKKTEDEQNIETNQMDRPNSAMGGGPPEIADDEIQYNETRDFLGQGSFGKVYSGRCRGKRVAVKVPLMQDLTDKQLEEFRHEVAVMKKLYHPNIVLFMGSCTEKGKLRIITELMHTDLEKLLQSNRQLTLYQRMKLAKDAALGMNWLHGITNIIHRDLKPANLLVDERLTIVKITDFGFSQLKEHNLMESKGVARGTPLWMSPEVLLGKPFNEKCDIYSYGIILWQILTRKEPYESYSEFKAFRNAVCRLHERPEIPNDTLPSLKTLIEKCWQPNFVERPSFKEIVYSLDEIIVETVITNKEAATFWTESFLAPKQELQEHVSWYEFVQRLQSLLGKEKEIPMKTWKALKMLLGEMSIDESKYIVTMSRFNQVVSSFGPFFVPSEFAYDILEQIVELMDRDWFHADISKEEAEKRLMHRAEGTFLVRMSSTTPEFPFTVSMINNQHRRIHHKTFTDFFSFKGSKHRYKTLVALIEESRDGDIVDLRFACPKDAVNSTWGYK